MSELDKKIKRESTHNKKLLQEKDREIARLKNEIFGSPGSPTGNYSSIIQKRPITGQAVTNQNEHLQREFE